MGSTKKHTLFILCLMSDWISLSLSVVRSSQCKAEPNRDCLPNYTYLRKINKCVKISDVKGPWFSERQPPCQGWGYIKIESKKDQHVILDFINGKGDHKNDRFFIGLHETYKGNFIWMSDKTPFHIKRHFHDLNLKNFRRRRASEKCASLSLNPRDNYNWHFVDCDIRRRGICEIPSGRHSSRPSIVIKNQDERYLVVGQNITLKCSAFSTRSLFYVLVDPITWKKDYLLGSDPRNKQREGGYCWKVSTRWRYITVTEEMVGKDIGCISKIDYDVPICSDEDIYCTRLNAEIVLKRPEEPKESEEEKGLLKNVWYIWLALLILLLPMTLLCLLRSSRKQAPIVSEEASPKPGHEPAREFPMVAPSEGSSSYIADTETVISSMVSWSKKTSSAMS